MGIKSSRAGSRKNESEEFESESSSELSSSSATDRESTDERRAEGSSPALANARGSGAPIQRSATAERVPAQHHSGGSGRGYVAHDPGPGREPLSQRYGLDVREGQARTLQRLETEFGRTRVNRWADQGMSVETMGKPRDMRAFRKRQKDRPAEVPTDVERRNEASVQRNAARNREPGPAGETVVPDAVRAVVSSPGRSMDGTVQREMETKVGGDFDDVRVHTGPRAAAAAEAIGARAFTVGNHVAFNSGEYQPDTRDGRGVLAHELTHVRQQTKGVLSLLPKADAEHPFLHTESGSGVYVQPKLAVSSPDDPAEREAERVAEEVMGMSEPASPPDADGKVQRRPTTSTTRAEGGLAEGWGDPDPTSDVCPRCVRRYQAGQPLNCEECEQSLAAASVQRRGASSPDATGRAGEEGERLIRSVRHSEGRKLPRSVRSFFEPRFGYDFGDVRVHAGTRADDAARSINAEAFTTGTDIAFRSGAYQPSSEEGKRLLAHELTHVVQQNGRGTTTVQRQAAGGCNPCPNPPNPDLDIEITADLQEQNIPGALGQTNWGSADVSFVNILQRERQNCNTCGPSGNQPEYDICPQRAVVRASVTVLIDPSGRTSSGPGDPRWYSDCANPMTIRSLTPQQAQAQMGNPIPVTLEETRLHEEYHIMVSEDALENQLSSRNDVAQVCPYDRSTIDNWVDNLETTWTNFAENILQNNPGEANEQRNAEQYACNNI